MSETICRIDQLSDEIQSALDGLNKYVAEACNEAADEAATYAVNELKATSPVRDDGFTRKYPPGSYAQSWAKKWDGTEYMGVGSWTIYNKEHYQITHLLEFGHVIAGTGRRSIARPHIARVNYEASQMFVEKATEAANRIILP